MARPQRVISKQVSLPERPRRPIKNTEPEGPFGPYMKNPPEYCKKKQIDSEGVWVEVVSCTFFCKENQKCSVYLMIKAGSKERTRRCSH